MRSGNNKLWRKIDQKTHNRHHVFSMSSMNLDINTKGQWHIQLRIGFFEFPEEDCEKHVFFFTSIKSLTQLKHSGAFAFL